MLHEAGWLARGWPDIRHECRLCCRFAALKLAVKGVLHQRAGAHQYRLQRLGLAKNMPFFMGFRLVESGWKWGLDAGGVKVQKCFGFWERKW